jgi:hypothetical protein
MTVRKRTFLLAVTAFFVALVLWLGISPPKTSRIFLNQRRAVDSIRNLNLAEHEYATQHPNAGFACDLGYLGEHGSEALSRVALVDRILASGTKSSYHFDIRCSTGVGRSTAYTITAVPVEPGTTGQYALCTDQSGEIWYSENGSPSDCLVTHKPMERKYK